MKFLLDTHTFIWFVQGNQRLSSAARTLIETPENQRLISTVSLWEIAIKMSLDKLDMDSPFNQLIPAQLINNNITILPITVVHLHGLIELPFHHRDPFDRLLIAQAKVEEIPLVTQDREFQAYDLQLMW